MLSFGEKIPSVSTSKILYGLAVSCITLPLVKLETVTCSFSPHSSFLRLLPEIELQTHLSVC